MENCFEIKENYIYMYFDINNLPKLPNFQLISISTKNVFSNYILQLICIIN